MGLRILAIVIIQTLALAYMIQERQHMLESGQVITLKVVPVDPRDIFRGDYVVLGYEISRLNVREIGGDDNFNPTNPAYVVLHQQDGAWKPMSVWHKRPAAAAGEVVLRGEVQYADAEATGPDAATVTVRNVNVTYGIESYFVPQGTGRVIEEDARKGNVSVDVAVGADGRAAIKAVRRGDKVIRVEGMF